MFLALSLYAAFLIAAAPASLLAWVLPIASNDAATLEHARGRIWAGKAAALVVTNRSGIRHRFEHLRWNLLGGRLMSGEITVRLQIDDLRLRGEMDIVPTPGALYLRGTIFELPASSLASYRPELSPAGLSGSLTIESPEFAFAWNGGLQGAATVLWRDAATSHSSVRPLGQFRIRIAGVETGALLRVDTVEGALHVEGEGAWSRTRGLSFRGTARAASQENSELAALLNMLGPPAGQGVHSLSSPRPH
jgi:general secretion pathway protein N